MKEIKILIQQLRKYPSNLFVYPKIYEDSKHTPSMASVHGVAICDKDGNQVAFIETGTNNGNVVID